MTDWPNDVNQTAIRPSYAEQPELNVTEFKPAVGPAKRRRVTYIDSDLVSFEMKLTDAEYASFKTFYHTTLSGGVLPFTRDHPLTGDAGTFVFEEPYRFVEKRILNRIALTLRKLP